MTKLHNTKQYYIDMFTSAGMTEQEARQKIAEIEHDNDQRRKYGNPLGDMAKQIVARAKEDIANGEQLDADRLYGLMATISTANSELADKLARTQTGITEAQEIVTYVMATLQNEQNVSGFFYWLLNADAGRDVLQLYGMTTDELTALLKPYVDETLWRNQGEIFSKRKGEA